MALDVEIYGYRQALAPSFGVSAAMHAALVLFLLLVPALLRGPNESWGSGGSGSSPGEAMSATLVSGIPLPPNPQAKPENVLATENKGLSRSVPAPKAKPQEDAQAIELAAERARLRKAIEKLKQREEVATATPPRQATPPPVATPAPSTLPPPKAPEDNTVPYGEGGPAAGPYTTVTAGTGAGGLKFGEGGTGNFGSMFGWYADVVARKVHEAWQSEVNPNVISAKRVYILFDIARNGVPSNIRIEQSSGVPSLDQSAVRAMRRIDTFGPLPAGYHGSSISVEFWFDYRR